MPLLELELNGALAVKERVPGAVTIFVDAPLDELERRLRERATESSGEIEERIALAASRGAARGEFDYVVENDDRERAADECVGDRRAGARRGRLPWPADDPSPHRSSCSTRSTRATRW